jgi:hypothetical protein
LRRAVAEQFARGEGVSRPQLARLSPCIWCNWPDLRARPGGARAGGWPGRRLCRPANDQAQKLLDGLLAGYVFEEDGPTYAVADTAALAWRVGPPGKPIARGLDVLTIRDGRVSAVRTLIAPEADA